MRNLALIFLTAFMIFISKSLYSQVLVTPGNINYPTIAAAFTAINSGDLSNGPKTITITGDVFETGPSVLIFDWHCSSLNIGTTGNFTVTSDYEGYIITVGGIPTVNIDGRIGGTGSDIALKFNNTVTGNAAYSSGCIRVDGSLDCNIKYVECKGGLINPQNGQYVVRFDDAADYTYDPQFIIEDCIIDGGLGSIYYDGNNKLIIRNNKLKNFGENGLYLYSESEAGTNNIIIEKNEFYNETPVIYRNYYDAIRVFPSGNCIIRENIINILGVPSISSTGIRIDAYYLSNLTIENNFISVFSPNANSILYGITVLSYVYSTSSTINNNHNTIHIGGVLQNAVSFCIFEQLNTSGTTYNQFNNICINERTSTASSYSSYIKINPGVTVNADYNCYWSPNNFAKLNLISYNSLSAYKTDAFPNEQNTKTKFVNFANNLNGDLHIAGSSIGDIDLAGVAGLGINFDIDNDPRDAVRPYKGADESAPFSGETTLNLKFYPEGFYRPASDQMIKPIPATIYLKRAVYPFLTVSSINTTLDVNGNAPPLNFNIPYEGAYYIVVSNWNVLTSWNLIPQNFTFGGMTNYDFSSSVNQAYGNNMTQIDASPPRWGVYVGDVNQDEIINNTDLTAVHDASLIYTIGNVVTDLNGDEVIDADDLAIVRNNEANSIHVVKP